MKKLTFLSVVSIVLVLINLALLLYFFQNQKTEHRGPRREGPKDIIIQKLHFDEFQAKQYEKLINEHRQAVKNKEREIQELKSKLYQTLGAAENDNQRNSIIKEIGEKHQELEQIHFSHFSAIKNICKKEQLNDFEELTNELANLFKGPPPPPSHHGKRPQLK